MGESKQFKEYESRVGSINEIEPEMELLEDADLRTEADQLRERARNGESLDDLLPEAFARDFGLEIVDYAESKPGIPPSARHVHELVETIRSEDIRILLAATYYSQQQVEAIVERTGCRAVRVPMGPDFPHGEDYISYMDRLVSSLAAAAGE